MSRSGSMDWMLTHLAGAQVGHTVEFTPPPQSPQRQSTPRLMQALRSQISGPWRAYLPGSAYHVSCTTTNVRVTRIA